jgi:hypothetical protein
MTNNSLKDDGGPAFPRAPFDVNDYAGDGAEGMTLRDWVMGQCVAAAFGATTNGELPIGPNETVEQAMQRRWADIARGAAMAADAMIVERNKS